MFNFGYFLNIDNKNYFKIKIGYNNNLCFDW